MFCTQQAHFFENSKHKKTKTNVKCKKKEMRPHPTSYFGHILVYITSHVVPG